ncbi:MAG: hypothetical protein H7A36_01595 [Chlamydiales bacterium]|nr:hypothetical protein [Chlamydiales bacterium]
MADTEELVAAAPEQQVHPMPPDSQLDGEHAEGDELVLDLEAAHLQDLDLVLQT